VKDIPSTAIAAKNRLFSQEGFLWFYELQTKDDPPQRYRLVSHTENVEFSVDLNGDPLTYTAAAVGHSVSQEDLQANLPSVTVTLQNVTREVAATLEADEGLVGQPARIMLAHESNLADGVPILSDDFVVMATEYSEKSASLKLGQYNTFKIQFPNQRAMRDHCRHLYRSPACGYIGALASCDKTLSGENGCEAHGQDEDDEGLPVIHPERGGFFPSIPRVT